MDMFYDISDWTIFADTTLNILEWNPTSEHQQPNPTSCAAFSTYHDLGFSTLANVPSTDNALIQSNTAPPFLYNDFQVPIIRPCLPTFKEPTADKRAYENSRTKKRSILNHNQLILQDWESEC